MKTITFTEFRKNASRLLSRVETGETIRILRHGRPVADIVPPTDRPEVPGWKKPGLRLTVRGPALSKAILEERRARP